MTAQIHPIYLCECIFCMSYNTISMEIRLTDRNYLWNQLSNNNKALFMCKWGISLNIMHLFIKGAEKFSVKPLSQYHKTDVGKLDWKLFSTRPFLCGYVCVSMSNISNIYGCVWICKKSISDYIWCECVLMSVYSWKHFEGIYFRKENLVYIYLILNFSFLKKNYFGFMALKNYFIFKISQQINLRS